MASMSVCRDTGSLGKEAERRKTLTGLGNDRCGLKADAVITPRHCPASSSLSSPHNVILALEYVWNGERQDPSLEARLAM